MISVAYERCGQKATRQLLLCPSGAHQRNAQANGRWPLATTKTAGQWLRADTRGRDGGIREELATGAAGSGAGGNRPSTSSLMGKNKLRFGARVNGNGCTLATGS